MNVVRSASTFLRRFLVIGLLSGNALAQTVPDLTNGGTLSSVTISFNLGPTGMRGMVYHNLWDSSLSRQIKVTAVDVGSPAAGILAVDDVILGASGTAAAPTNFTADARKSFANAINDAEARTPATLKLIRWRAGVTETVQITLQTMGAYSATAPYNCPKSALILQQGLAAVMAGESSGLFNFGTLSLLAGYNTADPANAARMARAEAEVLALIPNQQTLDVMRSVTGALNAGSTWERGHTLIVLSEYFLRTGDTRVIPAIRSYAVLIARNQTLFGTMSHVFSDPWRDGPLNGPMGSGYGPVNSAGMPCWLGLLLAKQCGISDPEIDPAIERANKFFSYYAEKGVIPYGEHQAEPSLYESNGKMGLAALAYGLQPTRATEARYYTRMATTSAREREIGHTGSFFNYLWAPLGAAAGGEAAAAFHFSEIRWMLDLNRSWTGRFVYDCINGEGAKNGVQYGTSPSFRMSTAALLVYALPLRNLYLTGKLHTPAQSLTPAELSDSQAAIDYKANTRTLAQLLTDIGSWSPVIRRAAANRILTFPANSTTINQLTTIATDAGAFAGARIEACYILGRINDEATAAARTATLVSLITDPENHVRFTSADALLKISNGYRLPHLNTILQAAVSTETPLFPISEEDPLHQAHARLCLLLFDSTDGIISGTKVSLAPKNLLYPAIKAVARNPIGYARGTLSSIYDYLTEEEMRIVSGPVIDAARDRSPADRMFSRTGRSAALRFLKKFDVAEGVPVALDMMLDDYALKPGAFDVLDQYAGASKTVVPDPDVEGFMQLLIKNGSDVASAQELLAIIAADTNPTPLVPLKSVVSVTADNPSLTLPTNWTTLRADTIDHAEGDSVFTWRKIHGAGNVTFAPNGTADSDHCVVLFDNTPGQYLFEVTMTDSRGLTEVSGTVAVALGPIPPNDPPVANSQSTPILRATPDVITLTGSDPEGYPLIYSIVDAPAYGTLTGNAPSLIYTPDFNYLGADTFTFRVMDSEGQLSATATVSITITENAGISASIYEPFDYPAGLLHNASGTSETGFSTAWNNNNNATSLVIAPSLTYGTLPVAGGSISTGGGGSLGGSRTISPSALANAGLLNNGSTLWFSAMIGIGEGANPTNSKVGFALANNGFNLGTAGISNDGAQLGSGLGVFLGRQTYDGMLVATQFRDPSYVIPTNPTSGNIYGTLPPAETRVGVGAYRFVVGKITWGATEDIVELFMPDENLNLGPVKSWLRANVDQATFDTFTWNKVGVSLLDEIRFGPTYYSVLAGNAPLVADTTAPGPVPMSFQQAPTPVSPSSMRMEAVPVTDASGVEYYFTCTAGGGSDSGWQTSTIFTPTGLTPGVLYSYTVKARDNSPALNQTAPSPALSATISPQTLLTDFTGMSRINAESIINTLGMNLGTVTLVADPNLLEGSVISQSPPGNVSYNLGTTVNLSVVAPDTFAPTPNPATFAVAPTAVDYHSITMTATTGTDPTGVQYLFTETSGNPGGTSSGWQDSPVYADTGLTDGTQYTYTVTLRDKSAAVNYTAASTPASATTITLPPSTITYWDGGNGTWGDVAKWSLTSGATTPDPAATPIFVDTAILNTTTGGSTAQDVALDGDRSIASLIFRSGTPHIVANTSGTTARSLTIGSGGITINNTVGGNFEIGRSPTTLGAVNIILAANQAWTNNDDNTMTVNGNISGNAQLTKNGTGSLTLGGTNSFTGGVIVNNGTLTSKDDAHSFLGSSFNALVTVNSGARLNLGRNTITGTMILNGGRVDTTNGFGATWSGSIILQSTSFLLNGGVGGLSINAVISGPGGITRTTGNAANLGLNSANTFTGDMIWGVTNSRLVLNHFLALQNSTLDTTNSGLGGVGSVENGISTNQTTLTLGGLSGNKDLKSLFATNATAGGYNNLTSLTLNPSQGKTPSYTGGIVNGATDMTVTKTGPGTQTLSGTNTYTGSTTVSEGALALVGGSLTSRITVEGGASLSFTPGFTTTTSQLVEFTSGSTVTISGTPILDSYTLMTATNGFIVNGTIGPAPPVPGYDLIVDGTALKLVANNAAPVWASNPVTTANAAEDIAYTTTLASLATDPEGEPLTFVKISGPAWLSVAPDGALSGTPVLSDVGVNVFTVSVSDGIRAPIQTALNITVLATNDVPVWTVNPLTRSNAITNSSYNIYAQTLAGAVTDEDIDPLTYTKVSGPAWLTIAPSGELAGTPLLADAGANVFTVSVSDGIAPPVTATLNITVLIPSTIYWDNVSNTWDNAANWTTNPAAATPDPLAVPGFADTAIFNRTGANTAQTITLDANPTLTGLTFNSTGSSTFRGNSSGTTNRTLTIGGGGITSGASAGGAEIGNTPATYGAVNIVLAANQIWNIASSLTVQGTISGNAQLTKNGAGQLRLNGNNTFTGGIIINGGLVFNQTGSVHSFLGSATDAQVTVNSPGRLACNGTSITGTMTLNGGTADATNPSTWKGSIILQTTSSLQGNSGSGTLIIDGVISGAGGLTKGTSGNLTLTNANTFTGDTISGVTGALFNLNHSQALQNSTLNTTSSAAGGLSSGIKTNKNTLTLGGLSGNKDLKSLFQTDGTAGGYNNLTALTLNPGTGKTPLYTGGIVNGATGMTLTKTGTGTQTLSGTNTYTGATTVSEGTLALVGGSQTSPITVASGASLGFTLGSTTTSTSSVAFGAGTIAITGTPTLASYTLMSATGGFTGTPVLSAPLIGYALQVIGNDLKLVYTASTAYQAWATAQGLTGSNALPASDPDSDTNINLLEFAFGTNPNVGGGGALAYVAGSALTNPGPPIALNLAVGAGVDYRAIFSRRKDHVAAGLTYTVQFSADMSNWVNSAANPTILTGDNIQNPGDIEAVSVPYPLFVPVTGGYKKPTFFRVTVAMP